MKTATDQRTLDYFSNDPRRVLAACGDVSEDVRRAWAAECERIYRERKGDRPSDDVWWTNNLNHHGQSSWFNPYYGQKNTVKNWECCNLLRCLIPPPDLGERVECPECKGNPKYGVSPRFLEPPYNRDKPCQTCHGTGSITLPFVVDPRWLTSTVVDLVGTVRGGWYCPYCGEEADFDTGSHGNREEPDVPACWYCPDCGITAIERPLRFDLMPILADALEDAGCDCEAMIEHLRSDGPHVRGCWVLKSLTGGK